MNRLHDEHVVMAIKKWTVPLLQLTSSVFLEIQLKERLLGKLRKSSCDKYGTSQRCDCGTHQE
jgi:hypothetical protein